MWKKYNSKKEEFFIIDHTDRSCPRMLFVCMHLWLFSFNTVYQYLYPRFRLAFSPTLYKFIVWTFWAWVHSCSGFKSKLVLTIGAVCGQGLRWSEGDFGLVHKMEESGSHQPTIGLHQGNDNLHQVESGGSQHSQSEVNPQQRGDRERSEQTMHTNWSQSRGKSHVSHAENEKDT